MAEGVANIGKKDVVWNLFATFFKIGAGVLLFPFILRMMPTETVGIWTIFTTITGLVALLDFGFNPSFTRNITYIFSGVQQLQITGIIADSENKVVNYSLLKGTIKAMQWFYSRMAIIVFIVLVTAGTYYLFTVLKVYTGNKQEVYIAWGLLCIISTYNLYTLYYDSLMQGKGLVMRSKQIQVLGHGVYLILAAMLIMLGQGLIAIVAAQAISVITIRILSYKCFFTRDLKTVLSQVQDYSKKTIIKAIYPNAVKVGLTSLGGFMVNKSAIIIGAMYLNLDEIASYGITMQVIGIISGVATVYYTSYLPKIFKWRVEHNIKSLKSIYFRSVQIMVICFFLCGAALLLFGDWGLEFIGSQTILMPKKIVFFALIIMFLETNHGVAGGFLLAKNEVPFFKAALVSGAVTVILLLIMLSYLHWGLWGMVLAQGIAQGVYQNWKWPLMIIRELKGGGA